MNKKAPRKQPVATRRKLLDATTSLVLQRGFHATTVDEICAAADVTKGSFFHHFENKEDIARAAVRAWGEMGQSLYAEAWKTPGDPLAEIHRLLEIMDAITRQFDPCVCFVGMLAQETARTNPTLRAACADELATWAEMLRSRLAQARHDRPPAVDFDPAAVGWFLCSLWQGSMLTAKTRQNPDLIRTNLKLARAYVDSLFATAPNKIAQPSTPPAAKN
jgi:TetR/AcrR family transcriptional regulator, transcriptional repressor for nem operon